MSFDHTMRQAACGEFSPLDAEAREAASPLDFALAHKSTVRTWGRTGSYAAVRVDGTDYLWRVTDGEYDGWDRPMKEAP